MSRDLLAYIPERGLEWASQLPESTQDVRAEGQLMSSNLAPELPAYFCTQHSLGVSPVWYPELFPLSFHLPLLL